MNILHKLAHWEKKFPLSLVGISIALIFGILTVYSVFLRDNSPSLSFEILNSTNVLNVNENLEELEIYYNNTNLKKSNQSLRVITIRVINDGPKDISRTHYDNYDTLGFGINVGKILRTEVITASNNYLLKNLKVNISSERKILFSNVILESEESYVVKSLILHPEDSIPEIKPTGKIMGVKSILVSNLYYETNKPSFLQEAFIGSFWIQIIRLVIYFIGFTAILFSFASVFFYFVRWFFRYGRKRIVQVFKQASNSKLTKDDEIIFYYYIYHGIDFLSTVNNLLSDEERLQKLLRTSKMKHDALLSYRFLLYEPAVTLTDLESIAFSFGSFGFVELIDGNFIINRHKHALIKELLNFVLSYKPNRLLANT